MDTAKFESAPAAHSKVAVIGVPHAIKGQGINALTTNAEVEPDEALRAELVEWRRPEIGPSKWTPGMMLWSDR